MSIPANTIAMDRAMDVMAKNLNSQDLPRVGIFWYDTGNDDLFGVVSSQVLDWINKYPNAKPLIIEEFNLNEQQYAFEVDTHWEVGHGWEGW